MGKKKKKKNRKQKKYNKNQFIDIVCKQCDICRVYSPSYCYNIAYRENPELFMREVYTKLLGHKNRIRMGGKFVIQHFREVFCYSGLCGPGHKMSCKDSLSCFNSFNDQISGVKLTDKRKVKKHKEPYVPVAYPTFFISDNKAFKKEIEGILGDGNRDIKQNNDKRSTISTS